MRAVRLLFVPLFVCAAAIAAAQPLANQPPAPSAGKAVTIIYATDIRGKIDPCDCKYDPRGGLPRMATFFNGLWDAGVRPLTVDAGDLFGAPDAADRQQTQFLCHQIASFGYDAIGLGEKDLNYGLPFLKDVIANDHLPFTSANVHDAHTGELILPEYLVVEKEGVKFGIVSVLDPQHPIAPLGGSGSDFTVDDPVTALRDVLPAVRMVSDTVVLLSHLSENRTRDLLRQVDGVDIAVGGHTNASLESAQYVGDVLNLCAAFESRYLGRADVRLAGSDGHVLSADVHVIPLDNSVADDKEMAARVADFKAQRGM